MNATPGIADVEAIDEALVNGPGLRWSVIGAHMGYHLGGGAGGIEAYLEHLGPSQERRWQSLGNPRLTPEVRAALVAGVMREAAGRDIATLEAERFSAAEARATHELAQRALEREIAELVLVNAIENYHNLLNLPLDVESDGLEALARGA